MKKPKVFYNGRHINGRFDSFKAKVNRIVRFLIRWSLISAAGYALVLAGATFFPNIVVATNQVEIDTTPQKLAALKADIVNRLSDCERAGHSEDDGIIIFDSNAKASIGVMQFQKATVIYYEKQLYGRDITAKDAVLIALDAQQAKALAQDIIFKSKNGTSDWLNCSNKLGLAQEVKILKKLEQ